MSTSSEPISVEICRFCGQIIDIRALAPLSHITCPACSQETAVLPFLGPFKLEKLLGQGGMASVYQALDLNLNRHVALKALQHDPQPSSASSPAAPFRREAILSARVHHPNVAQVYSSGSAHGVFYIAMELIPNGSLHSKIVDAKTLPETEVLRIGIQIAEGLQAALHAGLMHRDIKPANILFGAHQEVKIVDFGLALPFGNTTSSPEDLWGTPDYIAPEGLHAKQEDARSDIYALGATLWHALTGAPPHHTDTTSIQELLRIKRTPIDLAKIRPDLHPLTIAAIHRCLAFHPVERTPSYSHLIADLQHALQALQAPSIGHQPTPRSLKTSWRTPTFLFSLLCSILLAASASALLWKRASLARRSLPTHPSTEARLHEANSLLASGQLEEATSILQLLLRLPHLSPTTEAWCHTSLATAFLLESNPTSHLPHLQALTSTNLPADPALSALFRSLPALASAPSPPNVHSVPGEAFQHLWMGLLHLQKSDWANAHSHLAQLAQRHPAELAPASAEIQTLLPLASLLEAQLSSFLQLQSLLHTVKTKKDLRHLIEQTETSLNTQALLPLIRTAYLTLLTKARSDTRKLPEA